MQRKTIQHLQKMKKDHKPIVAMTAYDVMTARLLQELDFDVILVGDSLGMVVLGYDTTLPVTVDEMIHHAKAVVRGAPQSLVVVDMPFMSYQAGTDDALRAAGKIIKESGAQAVKVEGGLAVAPAVKAMVDAGIPVMGHLGLLPQAVHRIGGYKVQGRTTDAAQKMRDEAAVLEDVGCFALVLECLPEPLAKKISEEMAIPTIGIGAGRYCDGQILVSTDVLGLDSTGHRPKFVKAYADGQQQMREAFRHFQNDVRARIFPAEEHSYPA